MRYLILLTIVVLGLNCKKPDEPVLPTGPQMPERTETGANIVACKVNGNIHAYKGKLSWNHPDGVEFGYLTLPGQYYVGEGTKEHTYTTENGSGVIKFSRHDSLVIAGTFSFTAVNPGGEKVEVTEGFFDIVPE